MEKLYLKDLEKADWNSVKESDSNMCGTVYHYVHMYSDDINIYKVTGNCRECGKQITNICVWKPGTKTMHYHVLDDGSLLPFNDFEIVGVTDGFDYTLNCDECHASAVVSYFGKRFTVCELEGSERQVAWAVKIRNEKINSYHWFHNKQIIKAKENGNVDEIISKLNRLHEVFEFAINKHSKASWWLDNRYKAFREIAAEHKREWLEYTSVSAEERAETKKIEMDAKAEATAIPKDRTHDGVADITITDKQVTVSYPKDNDFRAVVKGIGYRWDGTNWYKDIGETTGTAQERAAELGNKLLVAGFAICIFDPDTRKRAVEADYEPETHRWVGLSDDSKKFLLSWEYGNDRIYSSSRRIHGSRWDKPYVTVPVTEYTSVLDFANQYSFRYTAAAHSMVDKMEGKVVEPAKEKETVI